MKIQINTAVIAALNPCESRFENWKMHYKQFDSDIIDFLQLSEITHSDKFWVSLRILPRNIVVDFAKGCVKRAKDYADSVAASDYATAYAAYAATYADAAAAAADAPAAVDYAAAAADAAADAYAATAAYAAERENQIDALIMLVNLERNKV